MVVNTADNFEFLDDLMVLKHLAKKLKKPGPIFLYLKTTNQVAIRNL